MLVTRLVLCCINAHERQTAEYKGRTAVVWCGKEYHTLLHVWSEKISTHVWIIIFTRAALAFAATTRSPRRIFGAGIAWTVINHLQSKTSQFRHDCGSVLGMAPSQQSWQMFILLITVKWTQLLSNQPSFWKWLLFFLSHSWFEVSPIMNYQTSLRLIIKRVHTL